MEFCLSQAHPTHNNQGGLQSGMFGDKMLGVMWSQKFSLKQNWNSPACMAWHRILLSDVGSSSSHFLNSMQRYLLLAQLAGAVEYTDCISAEG